MIKIGKYILYDMVRNRFVMAYTFFLLLVTLSMFSLDSDPGKSTISLMNIVLLVVPLVSIVFTTIHFYNSYEFMEMLLAQPVHRKTIYFAEYLSVSIALSVAFLSGVALPLCVFNFNESTLYLILIGVMLTFIFVALAFAASVATRDKARAIGIALLFWFYFAIIYDGLVLYIIYTFSDYPMEKVTLSLVSLNPIDLARIVILLKLDVSAMMGYTGAFYQNFFGSGGGIIYSLLIMIVWILLPLLIAHRKFCLKDI
ncbi:MAG: ABC transporter permease subunit [Cyclobacteriaceae bacterium]|jgi:Cu-processing system permease protein|nr:ABC transporter permease [Flammeovirgaceae bacterium]